MTRELIVSPAMQEIWSNLESPKPDPKEIVKLALGPKKVKDLTFTDWEALLAEIIVGDAFGVDRMDCLLRDSLHNFMFSQVYFHSVRRIYDIHLKDFLSEWTESGCYPTDPERFLTYTDAEIVSAMRKSASLIKSLRLKGSWCGEAHIQKAAFFLKHLTEVPVDFDFILYKHGPFSFDLRDELSVMRAFDLLTLEDHYPYGPRVADTAMGDKLCERYPKTLARYEKQINYIADKLGDKEVVDLERLATAYYVTLEDQEKNQKARAAAIVTLKPHLPLIWPYRLSRKWILLSIRLTRKACLCSDV